VPAAFGTAPNRLRPHSRSTYLPFATTVRCVHKAGAGKQILSAGQQNPRQLSIVAKHPVDRKLPEVKPGPRFLSAGTESELRSHSSACAQIGDSPLSASHEIICVPGSGTVPFMSHTIREKTKVNSQGAQLRSRSARPSRPHSCSLPRPRRRGRNCRRNGCCASTRARCTRPILRPTAAPRCKQDPVF
jgi:hypothetical protein